MRSKKFRIALAVGVVTGAAGVASASATTVELGLQDPTVHSGHIYVDPSWIDGSAVSTGSLTYGAWNFVSGTGSDGSETATTDTFTGQFTAKNIPGKGKVPVKDTLTVWVTETGLIGPSALQDFLGNFQETSITKGWTVVEKAFYDTTDTAFGTQNLINAPSGTTWTSSPGSFVDSDIANLAGKTYSLTEEFMISNYVGGKAAISGNASGETTITYTINVPEASTWAMLGLGFAGVGFVGLRRRKGARYAI